MRRGAAAVLLHRLAGDAELGPLRRRLAWLLDLYQRAPVHLLADAGWGDFDWMLSSLLRTALLRACRRRTAFWRRQPRIVLPSSDWAGSLLVVTVWVALVVAAQQLFAAA